MPFTNNDFPNQIFNTPKELVEAYDKRREIEKRLSERSESIPKVTATILPISRTVLEKEIETLRQKVKSLQEELELDRNKEKPKCNKDNLPIGMILQGDSKGTTYTLEVLPEGYLCSTGQIEHTLSSAAERVSGNRRSGWKFWKDFYGNPIGEATGRFKKDGGEDNFGEPSGLPVLPMFEC